MKGDGGSEGREERMGKWSLSQRSKYVFHETLWNRDEEHKVKSIVEKEPLEILKCVGDLWSLRRTRSGEFLSTESSAFPRPFVCVPPQVGL